MDTKLEASSVKGTPVAAAKRLHRCAVGKMMMNTHNCLFVYLETGENQAFSFPGEPDFIDIDNRYE